MADEALELPSRSAYENIPVPPATGKRGLFGPKQPAGPSPEMTGMTEQLSGIAARLRVQEERFNELRKKMLFIEQNMLANHKKALAELKISNEEVDELRHKIIDVEDRVITIIKELRMTARKGDIDVLKRYIELWDPVKFVTADYAEKIARDILDEHKHEHQNI